nr:hypothetical protein GCM10025699_26520 [Microbacterium flavescens]
MASAGVLLHLAADDAAARVPHRQTRADLVREREQVELLAELAVVALGGLLEALLVGAQLVLRRPRGAVDALQLRVLLAPRQYAPATRWSAQPLPIMRVFGR